MSDFITTTWTELGKKVECLGTKVFVRTEAMPEMIGSLYLPPKKTQFYGELLGIKQFNEATVLSVGPEATLSPGDKICFLRLYFARYEQMEDRTMTGWVDEQNIIGIVDPQ